jgi:hypothetical protein
MARRRGSKGYLSMTHSACAVLVAAALSASVAVPAYGQTVTEPTQTTTTPTETTPTETTPAPTTTAPAPASPEETSSTNEYVESVPTGGGQAPASHAPETVAPARAAPAPAAKSPSSSRDTTPKAEGSTPKPKRAHRKKEARTQKRRQRHHEPAAPRETRPVVSAPAAATTEGEPANPLLLGLALLAITVAVLSTAVARRQGAGA